MAACVCRTQIAIRDVRYPLNPTPSPSAAFLHCDQSLEYEASFRFGTLRHPSLFARGAGVVATHTARTSRISVINRNGYLPRCPRGGGVAPLSRPSQLPAVRCQRPTPTVLGCPERSASLVFTGSMVGLNTSLTPGISRTLSESRLIIGIAGVTTFRRGSLAWAIVLFV